MIMIYVFRAVKHFEIMSSKRMVIEEILFYKEMSRNPNVPRLLHFFTVG